MHVFSHLGRFVLFKRDKKVEFARIDPDENALLASRGERNRAKTCRLAKRNATRANIQKGIE